MMKEKETEILEKLDKILASLKITTTSKYLTAKEVEREYGINPKTLLNRSSLPVKHKRYVPSLRLNGGRKKYFERKVIDRFFSNGRINQ